MSHMTWEQALDVAQEILILGRVWLHTTKETCKTMSCPIRYAYTTMSFPEDDISRMSYLTEQFNTTLITLDILTHVEFRLLLHYAQPARRQRFGLRLSMSTLAWVLLLQFPMSSAVLIHICSLWHVESRSATMTLITTTCRMLYACPNLDLSTSLSDLNYHAYFLCRVQTPTSLLCAMLSWGRDMPSTTLISQFLTTFFISFYLKFN